MRRLLLPVVSAASVLSMLAACGQDGLLPRQSQVSLGDNGSAVAIQPLTVKDGHFVNSAGETVRFWGINLVALYPTRQQADNIAETLSERGFNLARPHHLLRPSKDWVWGIKAGALVTYEEDSRTFDEEALDRFDYLNAQLRERGIYLAMSTHFTRSFLPGDTAILDVSEEDNAAWASAIEELNSWHWKKSFDVQKLLPVIDERCALLSEEFARNLLDHVNPYTGIRYADDPQVVSMEILNESSTEYAIICNNKLPEYFHNKLVARWEAFCEAEGVEAGDIYNVSGRMVGIRARFLRKLDEDYFLRMKNTLAATGSTVPVTFSNLWRGDNVGDMHYQHADWVENHAYVDPRVVDKLDDGIFTASRNTLEGKPFMIGELNQSEGRDNIQREKPYRTMLQVAMVAYGLLQDWDGLIWFAWNHGDTELSPEGGPLELKREPRLGTMMSDGMMQDHLRTMGYIFTNELISPSVSPVTIWVDQPFTAGDYHGLMRGKNRYRPGWQSIHGFRKAYGAEPAEQASAPWMTGVPEGDVLVSDTGEIIKDTARRQLTVAAPRVEIFSGFLDGASPAGPKHLQIPGDDLFSTVACVSLDGLPLDQSTHLLLSKTTLDAEYNEVNGEVYLSGLTKTTSGKSWVLTVTRAMGDETFEQETVLSVDGSGVLKIPATSWTECEIVLK